jgi:hypothetical protein
MVADWPHWISFGQNGVDMLHETLQGQGCETHFYSAQDSGKVRRAPKRYQYHVKGMGTRWNMTEAELKEETQEWEDGLRMEKAALDAAIDAHEAHLESTVETGVFHIYAHGVSCAFPAAIPIEDCGAWCTGIYTHDIMWLWRRNVNGRFYRAAHRHVCEQIVLDSSCSGACTPKIGSNMNRTGKDDCQDDKGDDCCKRAGYRGDAWLGSSSGLDSFTWDWPVRGHQNSLDNSILAASMTGDKLSIVKQIMPADYPSSYIDPGYGVCCP